MTIRFSLLVLIMAACGGNKALDDADASIGGPDTTQRPGWIDVTEAPYNAQGDGKTDDTAAIQQALTDSGKAGGGIVFVPTGRYRIATHLSIPTSTTLKGVFVAPSEVDLGREITTGPGSMLLAEEGAGNDSGTPFITLSGHNAGIDGFIIFYPHQTPTDPPVKYPYSIGVGVDPGPDGPRAQDVFIQNVTLANSYNGIDLGSNDSTRHFVNNVYGQPEHIGIFVDRCYDIGRIENVQFNGNWSAEPALLNFMYREGIAFLFYRSDGEYMSNIYAWGYSVGIQFQNSPTRENWTSYAYITNLGLETCDVGVLASDTAAAGIEITNYDYATPTTSGPHRYALWLPRGTNWGSDVSLQNATVGGAYRRVAVVEQPIGYSSLLLVGNSFLPTTETADPLVDIQGGNAVVSDNLFPPGVSRYPAVHVAGTADEVVITNNLLGNGQIIVDPEATHTVVANNVSAQ